MADAFVLPSECEPWGLAVNEAMACGTAVVVSDQVGSAPDLVDASNGAVFNAGDVQGLANALRHVLANAGPMGRAASDKIGSWNFDADISGLKAALGQLEVRP
jgi:glycosyltransferase involved in cell wall biosynthesis